MAIAQAIRWPFVGRGRQVEEFEHLLTDSRLRAFVLAGPAGVGKTRVARELLLRAEDLGHPTASVFASASASTVPLSAMAALVPVDVQGLPPDELFARVRTLVREQRGDRRLVLFVDDVDQLDAASLALVAALVDGGDALLVATLREGATVPDVVGRWWQTGDGLRHDLDVLGPIQVDGLLHLALGGPMTATARQALVANSGGNPLYLRELVLTGIEQGALAERDGVWTLEGPLPTSGGLAAVVEARLSDLTDDQRALVERLALCQPLGLDDLLTTVPAEALENLESRSLITVETDRRRTEVSLAHPLHTAVIRESIPRLRARSILLDEIERIESRGARRRDDALRLAVWRLDATGTADTELLVRAARQARHGHDLPQVERLARAALVFEPNADASALLAEALAGTGEPEAADSAYADAIVGLSGLAAADVAMRRAANLYYGLGRGEDALAVLDEAASHAASDPRTAAVVELTRVAILAFEGRVSDALAILEQVDTDDPLIAVMRSWGAVVALLEAGRLDEARSVSEAALSTHHVLDTESGMAHTATHLIAAGSVGLAAGRLDDAESLGRDALDRLSADGVVSQLPWAHLLLARAALIRGEAVDAVQHARSAITAARSSRGELSSRLASAVCAHALAVSGNVAEAAALIESIDDQRYHTGDVATARAWVLVGQGDNPGARDLLRAAAGEAAAQGRVTTALTHAYDVLRLGDDDAAGMVIELAAAVEGELAAIRGEVARARAQRDPAGLSECAERFGALGATVLAAEASFAAAQLLRADGQPRTASAASARARALLGADPSVRTPGLTDVATATPLTAREREIAELAAAGRSSKEIADRLVLSVRTVDNHLQRVYAKLGVTGRSELADVLGAGTTTADRQNGNPEERA